MLQNQLQLSFLWQPERPNFKCQLQLPKPTRKAQAKMPTAQNWEIIPADIKQRSLHLALIVYRNPMKNEPKQLLSKIQKGQLTIQTQMRHVK